MVLSGPEFDRFMELSDGMTLTADDGEHLRVELGRRGLHAVLRKRAHGAALKITASNLLSVSGTNMYMYDEEGIFRVQTESTQKAQELLSMLKWTDEMYIRESEIGSVIRNLLTVFQEYGSEDMKGVDPENYQQEQPAFEFYLDYPEEGVLSCRPYAVYTHQGFRSSLYDSESDAGRRNASVLTHSYSN